jgi:NDP-sugar pyrophosphorylase family protein
MGEHYQGDGASLRAIILSAGYGTRLRPITDRFAKPMVRILGIPVIEYTLNLLNKSGIKKVLINRHYFPEQFDDLKIPQGMDVVYSIEKEILGTLGGILSFRKELEDDENDDFIVINGDVIFDISIEDIILKHKRKKNLVTMVLGSLSFNEKATPIYVDDFSNVVSIGGTDKDEIYKKYMFAGVHIVNKNIFKRVKKIQNDRPSCIVKDLYIPYINSGGHINAFLMGTKDLWLEIGDIKKYLDANLYILDQLYKYKINFNIEEFLSERLGLNQLVDGIWLSSGVFIDHDATIIPPVVIGSNSRIEKGAMLGPNVIVGEDVLIAENVKLEDTVVLDTVNMIHGQRLKRAVVVSNDFIWNEPDRGHV